MKTQLFANRQRSSVLILACLLVLLAASLVQGQWPDYTQLAATLDQPSSRLRWIVGDISEVAFYKHELPALGLLLGACLAHWAHVQGYRWQGFAICYGSGLWPWVFTSYAGPRCTGLRFAAADTDGCRAGAGVTGWGRVLASPVAGARVVPHLHSHRLDRPCRCACPRWKLASGRSQCSAGRAGSSTFGSGHHSALAGLHAWLHR